MRCRCGARLMPVTGTDRLVCEDCLRFEENCRCKVRKQSRLVVA